jgi:condensin-2 complex subunit D3
MMEIVLPILCNLKAKLQASHSPLLKDLMGYLLEIFRNYKTEVKEFLANDPTLLQEIEYDARQHSNQKH